MRKTALVLAIVLLLTATLAIPAQAAQPRAITAVPGLTINGTTATCSLRSAGNYSTDEFDATIKLYRGSTCIATWTAEGTGYLGFSKTKTITAGYTYTLKTTLTVNGVNFPVADVVKNA